MDQVRERTTRMEMINKITLALLILPSALLAQTDSGLVTGFVSDPSGAVVVNAAVTLKSPQTGSAHKATTGASGSFTISAVVRGTYDLVVEAAGFSKSQQTGLEVNIGGFLAVWCG